MKKGRNEEEDKEERFIKMKKIFNFLTDFKNLKKTEKGSKSPEQV